MMSMLRFGRIALIASLVFVVGPTARAQRKAPIPRFTGESVIVVGVPDRYDSLAGKITRLERASPQSYYVVVVNSTGPGQSATREYADQLFEDWQRQGSRRGRSFDPERSVIFVVALENRQVAVKPGTFLINNLGMHANNVELDLIPVFVRLAQENRYPEAISSLLDETNNWIAARDAETPYVAVSVPASKAARTAAGATKTPSKVTAPSPKGAKLEPGGSSPHVGVTTAATPAKAAFSEWKLIAIVAVPLVVMVAAFLGWIWHLYRRTRGRVAGRIKELKSKAADVMDRLDGLKERLKLMPTSTEFKQPMTGETQALYRTVDDRLAKLWDGWLRVMDVLEKAQKLAARSGSPLSQKTLADAEELMASQGSFAEIEAQAQAIAVDLDRLDQAHQAARSVLEAVTAARPKIDAGLDQIKKLGLAPRLTRKSSGPRHGIE